MKSALALHNLREYITHTMAISGWERHKFGDVEFVYNGHRESLFNYSFCEPNASREDIITMLEFLKQKNWEATWPVDSNMKNIGKILQELNLLHASSPKKAFADITYFREPSDMVKIPNLKLVRVYTKEMITKYDESTSEIFYHDTNIVTQFIRGVAKGNDDKLQFFLVKVDDEYVGTCAMYMGSQDTVGFYADGVFRKFRKQGIASQMILEKIKIAQKYGYKYAIAHCMTQSVNLYERLGFRMLGNLKLYVSEAK